MQPTEPGRYLAQEIHMDMLGKRMFSQPYYVEVVEGVRNERNHRLLVKTDLRQPRYKALDCFEWPTKK